MVTPSFTVALSSGVISLSQLYSTAAAGQCPSTAGESGHPEMPRTKRNCTSPGPGRVWNAVYGSDDGGYHGGYRQFHCTSLKWQSEWNNVDLLRIPWN